MTSEVLVMAAVALLVAVPAVWCYNYLIARMEVLNIEMRNRPSEVLTLHRRYLAKYRGYTHNPGSWCKRLWLLKNSLPGKLRKQNRVRMRYKRFSRLAWTFSIPQFWQFFKESDFFNSHACLQQ
jgi:hypothetical protein